ncbi:MAG: ABC-F family ATP-binding cassette domain-containing protein [Actinomycetota bacterium]|nr:ABC-F family ATP-binding cassette domain-containing protein [Actinomycetota bacterium]
MPASPGSNQLTTLAARGVTLHRGLAPVLVGVDVTVGPADRIGVVGPNGVGKTTLLKILANELRPHSGSVRATPATATVGYLSQEPETRAGESLAAHLARRAGVAEAERELAEAGAALAQGSPAADVRYEVALERYLALGVADFEARRGAVLADLGLGDRLLDVPVSELSGGQRAKAALASLLLSRFDVLLLDEPTNDLDFDGLERLEAFIGARTGGLVVVSHDRAFLDRAISSVLEIDESSHRAVHYEGGFAAYLAARATARRHADQRHEAYVAARERLRAREREQRQWAVQGARRQRKKPSDGDKAQRDFRVNRTEKQASKVRITERAIERLQVVEKPWEGWRLNLDLATAPPSGDVVARLERAVVVRGEWRLGPVDLLVSYGERIALLGPNGAGKSTLLAALVGRARLDEGTRVLGPSVVIGELHQGRGRFVPGAHTLGEQFLATTGLDRSESRSLLAKFGLGADHTGRPAASLSPGERTRAELALLMAEGTNCLVLDEPTNHLDLPAIEQLEAALSSWPGTLLLVTHDRRLLESVALTRRISISGGAVVEDTAA